MIHVDTALNTRDLAVHALGRQERSSLDVTYRSHTTLVQGQPTRLMLRQGQPCFSSRLTRTWKSDGFTNQKFWHDHSTFGCCSSKSKFRTTCGTSFVISRYEMCFPRHVRDPNPNCHALLVSELSVRRTKTYRHIVSF